MNDIIKIIISLEDSGLLIDEVTEKLKHKIKKQEGGLLGTLLAHLAASLVQPVVSPVVKGICGSGVEIHLLNNIGSLIISIMNLDLMAFFFKKQFT